MFCEYCGEIIKNGVTKCPCCGAGVSANEGAADYNSSIPAATEDPYTKIEASLPPPAYTEQQTSTTGGTLPNIGMTARDFVYIIVSFMFPIVGLVLGISLLRKKSKVAGIICLIMGIVQSLSFVLPFLFVILTAILDSGALYYF